MAESESGWKLTFFNQTEILICLKSSQMRYTKIIYKRKRRLRRFPLLDHPFWLHAIELLILFIISWIVFTAFTWVSFSNGQLLNLRQGCICQNIPYPSKRVQCYSSTEEAFNFYHGHRFFPFLLVSCDDVVAVVTISSSSITPQGCTLCWWCSSSRRKEYITFHIAYIWKRIIL